MYPFNLYSPQINPPPLQKNKEHFEGGGGVSFGWEVVGREEVNEVGLINSFQQI